MKDYNHNGRIDSEDELLLQEMVKDRVDETIEKHSFSDGLKGFGLVIIDFSRINKSNILMLGVVYE